MRDVEGDGGSMRADSSVLGLAQTVAGAAGSSLTLGAGHGVPAGGMLTPCIAQTLAWVHASH